MPIDGVPRSVTDSSVNAYRSDSAVFLVLPDPAKAGSKVRGAVRFQSENSIEIGFRRALNRQPNCSEKGADKEYIA